MTVGPTGGDIAPKTMNMEETPTGGDTPLPTPPETGILGKLEQTPIVRSLLGKLGTSNALLKICEGSLELIIKEQKEADKHFEARKAQLSNKRQGLLVENFNLESQIWYEIMITIEGMEWSEGEEVLWAFLKKRAAGLFTVLSEQHATAHELASQDKQIIITDENGGYKIATIVDVSLKMVDINSDDPDQDHERRYAPAIVLTVEVKDDAEDTVTVSDVVFTKDIQELLEIENIDKEIDRLLEVLRSANQQEDNHDESLLSDINRFLDLVKARAKIFSTPDEPADHTTVALFTRIAVRTKQRTDYPDPEIFGDTVYGPQAMKYLVEHNPNQWIHITDNLLLLSTNLVNTGFTPGLKQKIFESWFRAEILYENPDIEEDKLNQAVKDKINSIMQAQANIE